MKAEKLKTLKNKEIEDMKTKDDTPYKRAVHMIIQSVLNFKQRYWLDSKFVRWARVEEDLFKLEDRLLSSEQPKKEIEDMKTSVTSSGKGDRKNENS